VDVEGLLDEVVGALLDGSNRDLDVPVAGDDDDRDLRVVAADLLEDLDPVKAALLEPDVEDDEIGRGFVDRREGGITVPGEPGAVSLVPEDVGDELADVGFIVHDENVGHQILSLNPVVFVPVSRPFAGSPCWPVSSGSTLPGSPRRAGAACGRVMRAQAPRWLDPSKGSAGRRSSVPSCSSTIFLTIGRPRPVPPWRWVT